MTRTSPFDFGPGPDADPTYQWDRTRKLFSLAEVCALRVPLSLIFVSHFYQVRAQTKRSLWTNHHCARNHSSSRSDYTTQLGLPTALPSQAFNGGPNLKNKKKNPETSDFHGESLLITMGEICVTKSVPERSRLLNER